MESFENVPRTTLKMRIHFYFYESRVSSGLHCHSFEVSSAMPIKHVFELEKNLMQKFITRSIIKTVITFTSAEKIV